MDGQLKPGDVLEGRYEVLAVLGQGGYGVVYEARQRATGQRVAVKLLLTERLKLSDDLATHEARFQREMQLIGSLKHPNIVRLIDSGRLVTGQLYTVLELVEGQPLAALIGRGPLPVRAALRLMGQVLEALHHAHARGVIHRDLKPQNIMVSGDLDGRPNAMVLDFGIATLSDAAAIAGVDPRTLTQTGQLHGTPAYMAPEQLQGEASPRSDLYAWGLVLLECLTGEPAVKGGSVAEVIYFQLSAQRPPLPIPLEGTPLHGLLARALEKDAARRYGDAAAALADLEQAAQAPLPEVLPPRALGAPDPTTDTLPGLHTATGRLAPARAPGQAAASATARIPGAADTRARWLLWAALVGGVVLGGVIVSAWLASTRAPLPLQSAPNGADTGPSLCPAGQQISRKTNGQCCWPGQSSNGVGSRCVGVPTACPVGYSLDAVAQTCALLPCHGGLVRMPDGLHCCWQGQAWDTDKGQCVGADIQCDLGPRGDGDGYYRDLKPNQERDHASDPNQCFWLGPTARTLHLACANDGPDKWRACAALGARLLTGDDAEPNPRRGADHLQRACAQGGEPSACLHEARMTLRLTSDDQRADALQRLRSLCDEGHPRACHALAAATSDAPPLTPWRHPTPTNTAPWSPPDPADRRPTQHMASADPATACRALADGCALADPLACHQLATAQSPGGLCAPAPAHVIARHLARACDRGRGYPIACTHLADLLTAPPTGEATTDAADAAPTKRPSPPPRRQQASMSAPKGLRASPSGIADAATLRLWAWALAVADPTTLRAWACDRGEPLACARLLRAPPAGARDEDAARWQALACQRRMTPCLKAAARGARDAAESAPTTAPTKTDPTAAP
jgi:tRNA A-37 threonylcarbamoyl transferase component Bud32